MIQALKHARHRWGPRKSGGRAADERQSTHPASLASAEGAYGKIKTSNGQSDLGFQKRKHCYIMGNKAEVDKLSGD